MKIIEAMKKVKSNLEKIADLRTKIANNSANTTLETLAYADTAATITGWLQAVYDIGQENIRLLTAIQRTNLATNVTVTLDDGTAVTKPISEWIWRRREYAAYDLLAWKALTDRGIKEETKIASGPQGSTVEVKIVRHFDPAVRDKMLALYMNEPHAIDGTLEVANAVTDLIE